MAESAEVGSRIEAARDAKGWTRAELAQKLSTKGELGRQGIQVTAHEIGLWETGAARPNATQRPAIAKILGIPEHELK